MSVYLVLTLNLQPFFLNTQIKELVDRDKSTPSVYYFQVGQMRQNCVCLNG